jgi:hypothetical protein
MAVVKMNLNHQPPGPEESGTKHLSAASGVAYGSLRPFTLPLNWADVGRKFLTCGAQERRLKRRAHNVHEGLMLGSAQR